MPECGYCKDCAWWDGNLDGYGTCGAFSAYSLDEVEEGRPTQNGSSAYLALEYGGYKFAFTTYADFGCIRFELPTLIEPRE